MYKYILFDLDGTLTDPYEGITKSVQYALNAFGIKDEPLEKLKKFIGPPLKESFMEYYGFDEAKAEAAVEKYRERFKHTGIFENVLYEGIKDMLEALKGAGLVLAIASSKPTVFVERILEHFGISSYFANITGSFLDGRRVKKSEVVETVLHELNVTDPLEALMVGDRHHDVEGARAAGVYCLGVSFGYGGREELEQAGAVAVVDTVQALKDYILGTAKTSEDVNERFRPVMDHFLKVWRLHGTALDHVTQCQGIYKSQMKMLGSIFHNEGISQTALAHKLEISPPSIAVTAKKLEKLGLIARKMDEKDNRQNILNTTKEGRELLGRTWKAFIGVDARMFDGFSDGELELLQGLYGRIEENLERINAELEKKQEE